MGFSQVKSLEQLEGQTFCQDPHCGDMLVFPAQLKAQLYSTKLLGDHKLIIQVQTALSYQKIVEKLLNIPQTAQMFMFLFW